MSTAKLVKFTPVEPGWVVTDRVGRAETPLFAVLPMIGYAHWEVTEKDGTVWIDIQAVVSNPSDLDYEDGVKGRIYFSRQLFREAQSDVDLELTRAQLKTAVSE